MYHLNNDNNSTGVHDKAFAGSNRLAGHAGRPNNINLESQVKTGGEEKKQNKTGISFFQFT